LRALTRALVLGVVAGLSISPVVVSAAAALGLSSRDAVVIPLLTAMTLVIAAAVLAILPSLFQAVKLPPAALLREAQ
jgi:hypothetical protein